MCRRSRIHDAGGSVYASGRFDRLCGRSPQRTARSPTGVLHSRSSPRRTRSREALLARPDQSRSRRQDQPRQSIRPRAASRPGGRGIPSHGRAARNQGAPATVRNRRGKRMSPNERAVKNHEQLFPHHVSTLAVTDPELIETFDNFAFDEVLRESKLDIKTRLIVQLAAIIACHALTEYKVMAGAALNIGVTPVEIKEIVYQSVPYVGMAKVFDFLHATNDLLRERGVEVPLPPQSTTTPENRMEKGLAVQKQIIGNEAVERLYANAQQDQMHIQRFLSANCFGDNYTRNGIDIRTRELLTLSMLVSLGGCDPQVKGHVAANLIVGNDRARLIDVVTQLLPFIGYPRTLNALRAIDEVTAANAVPNKKETR